MKSMKAAVPEETDAIRRRTRRALLGERIADEDAQFIIEKLDEIDARVVVMDEKGQREF